MKITRDTIYGNIGFEIGLNDTRWILIGFDWQTRCYIAQNCIDPSFIIKLTTSEIIGAEIIRDHWEDLIPYEKIHFNTASDPKDAGKSSSRDLFRVAKNSK